MEGKKFTYEISPEYNLIFVINSDEKDNSVLLNVLLHKIKNVFLNKYGDFILNFSGETTIFDDFKEETEKIIINSKVSVKCQTCERIIMGEYIEKKFDEFLVYFCCPSCEKYFFYDEFIKNSKE